MAVRVAIVDDEYSERETLQAYLKRYAAEAGNTIDVDQYPSADALLEGYRLIYDTLILDIDMPGINGMDAARLVRERDTSVAIIFITNMAQYAINGYEVGAMDYILKPISYYDFAMKFRRAMNWAALRGDREFPLETVDGHRRVRVADIIYVEARGHYLIYHMEPGSGDLRVRGNMKEHEELLRPYNVCRVHRSYLVNLEWVMEICSDKVYAGQTEIPIGRFYKDKLMQEYLRTAWG